MSKELEALENIKREAGVPYFSTLYDIDMWREDFATVEIALKALEIIKDEFEIDFDDKKQEINIQSVEYPYPHIRFSLTREIKDKCKYDLLKRFYDPRIDAA